MVRLICTYCILSIKCYIGCYWCFSCSPFGVVNGYFHKIYIISNIYTTNIFKSTDNTNNFNTPNNTGTFTNTKTTRIIKIICIINNFNNLSNIDILTSIRTTGIFKIIDSISNFGNTNTIDDLEMLKLKKGDSKALTLLKIKFFSL